MFRRKNRSLEYAVWVLIAAAAISGSMRGSDDVPAGLYRASTIPPALIPNSKAVIRYDNRVFTVRSRNSATLRVHEIVTVLKPEGRDFGELPLFYDHFLTVEDLEGKLYNAEGEEIRSLGSGDEKDYPVNLGATLYTDYRARVATLVHDSYPYSVEYRYTLKYNGYVNWPSWMPEEEDAAIEHSRYEVRLPADMKLRYRTTLPIQPETQIDDGENVTVWEASNLPPFEPEPFGPRTVDQYAGVEIAPDLFEIDGYEGDLRTWKSFGFWYDALSKNRQTLPDAMLDQVGKCISGAADKREKTVRLYKFLQSKTRYVNVALGVGGWQPYDAQYVTERGYGDCKALSNFMISLLRAAGITAYPLLIYSGPQPGPVHPEFPSNRFNHVMVCVPLNPDTLWLECTSQSLPAGHITANTELRPALLVTPQGGVLVTTPSSDAESNSQIRKASVSLVWTGDASAGIETQYTGHQRDDLCALFSEISPKEKEDWIRDRIHIGAFSVTLSDFSGVTSASGDGKVRLDLTLPRYASIAGKRMFFQPNVMNKITAVPKACPARKQPVVVSYPHLDIDSVTYTLPGGYTVEALPEPAAIDKPFARYSSVVMKKAGNVVQYVRRLEFKSSVFPPEQYEEFRIFLRDIVQADKAMAALVQRD